MYIRRKATDRLVCKVTETDLDLVLSTLPSGVYTVEDTEGNEVERATVKRSIVTYSADKPEYLTCADCTKHPNL